ncbi:DUF5590 domain-containing protein [Saccharibacillus sp. CPCC 101409]|uniref:cell wall elongation regulator TseB-like domain-containing protein n=1 Tax=Saccharibacillus sp. CPCC 101409 TaxID=3058041 RepID=UPI002673AFA6|nr:DUF5590 domain-containing protein [Saccharibacillus sp. CPCC 101409]MDO3409646.1 DUF5590 domain-containing protein [Saccharibacillus sp. CPCC 101409]
MSKRKKTILLIVVIALILLLGAYLYYTLSLQGRNSEKDAAIASARSQQNLTEVERADKWVWGKDSIYWVVLGKNAAGEEMYVWLPYTAEGQPAQGGSKAHVLPLAGTIARSDMERRVETELPEAKIIRMLPGFYDNRHVWQVFYEQQDTHYYRFYSMKDGSAIGEAFDLPKW